jgi:hypothetical protein
MDAASKMRRMFSRVQVVLALVAPFVYVKSLTNLSITVMSLGQLGYWLALPGMCFLGLSLAAISRSEEGFRVSRSGLWGAAVAGKTKNKTKKTPTLRIEKFFAIPKLHQLLMTFY